MKVNKVIPNWRFPETSERALSRSIQEATTAAVVILRDKLDALKFDATDDEIQSAEDDAEYAIIALFLALVASFPALARTIYKFNSQQWLIIAIATGGEDDESIMRLNQFGAIENEPWYAEKRDLWLQSSQNAVVKLARDIVSDWSTNVRVQAMRDATKDEVDSVIENRYAIYGSWSKNRASGIIGSFNSMLMKQRLKDANVSRYIWKGKMDERERPSHVALQNKSRTMSQFPFPGEEYGCRCWTVPDWSSKYR